MINGTLTHQKQAQNAIKWIDSLPQGKQAPDGQRSMLGNSELGFCCLGYGCHIFNIPYNYRDGNSSILASKVGLRTVLGKFRDNLQDNCYRKSSLVGLNDRTNAGFKGISKVMKNQPDLMFIPEVAKLIKEHYKGIEHD